MVNLCLDILQVNFETIGVIKLKSNKYPRFHVPFWLSYILVYLFYFRPSWDRK